MESCQIKVRIERFDATAERAARVSVAQSPSVENLNVPDRCGWIPKCFQTRATVACETGCAPELAIAAEQARKDRQYRRENEVAGQPG